MPLKERMGDEKIWRTTHTGKDDRASERLLLALLCLSAADRRRADQHFI